MLRQRTKRLRIIISVVCAVLAAVSACIVHPDREYINYFEPKFLTIVYSCMLIVSGLWTLKAFDKLSYKLFKNKNDSKDGSQRLTLTEMFASSQTKYHSLLIMYIMLMLVTLCVVLNVLPWFLSLLITVVLVLLTDKKTLIKPDYVLLAVLALLSVFAGNLVRMPFL